MAENLSHHAIPGRRLLAAPTHGAPVQPSFADLGVPLHEVTFVVVDLETTGGSPSSSAITEIGAVKVRGGHVLGEFQSLINPGVPIPPMITVLTGITTAMVITAPPVTQVLPAFLEFAHGAVLVAHNAGFDVGFLKAASRSMDLVWPAPQVVDTVRLARRVVTKEEAPNHKLATLAGLFGAATEPTHRALDDARATVDVLHALLGRMASLGVTHLEDLATAADPVPAARRRKAHLAQHLPTGPGVYQFIGPNRQVLYIGTATSLRRRVRTYFTAAEKRARIGEMVDLAVEVDVIECATALEAQVRELRLIAEHKPPYNRRSRAPERQPWLRLTSEAHPRLSIVRATPTAGPAIGPFPSHSAARQAQEAIVAAVPLRTCTLRLPLTPPAGASACVQAELGRCVAPCAEIDTGYEAITETARQVLGGSVSVVVAGAHRTISALAHQQRYEEAAQVRDRLSAFLRGAARTERLAPLQRATEIVAARRPGGPGSGWEVLVVRYGRMVGSARSRPGEDPRPLIEALRATGAAVPVPEDLGGAASAEETELLAAWLAQDGVRLVHWLDAHHRPGGWSMPLAGASAYLQDLGAAAFRDPRETEHRALGVGVADPASRSGIEAGMMDLPSSPRTALEETC
ncbi:DEDD exonuclease domain-containing protein [Pseudactinotalea sp. Z1748]|uniref:DEDD exonuclease domain-containing protein n=1 Tax=Pseudactinotalea sp. Z1748 TaxID=3413027 RepID=UPI003C7C8B99